MRSLGIVVRSRERSFAPTHVGANLAFARVCFQNEWISMSVVCNVFFVLVARIFRHRSGVKRLLKIHMDCSPFTVCIAKPPCLATATSGFEG